MINIKGDAGISGHELTIRENIQSRIYTIRGVQVMLDSDLAKLYGTETKQLNRAVKRNIERFPQEFMVQLTEDEYYGIRPELSLSKNSDNLRFQNGTSSDHGGRRYLPYAFTEQGVAMLSAVLKSETAVKISLQIINAFVAMRRFIGSNAQIFQRLDTLEIKQLETDKKMERVLNAIESKDVQPKQGIFFDGQIFDAYKFVADLIRTSQKSIILIDNYIDESVLTILTKRRENVKVILLTKYITNQMALDVKKYNEQYPAIELREFKNSHDRFIIIDNTTVYHFGASLKDLGKKWFAFSKMDIGAIEMLGRLEGMK